MVELRPLRGEGRSESQGGEGVNPSMGRVCLSRPWCSVEAPHAGQATTSHGTLADAWLSVAALLKRHPRPQQPRPRPKLPSPCPA